MKVESLYDTLGETLCTVLEQTAFMFPNPLESLESLDPASVEMLEIRVRFAGPRQGQVTLFMQTTLCQELAENMLGEQLEDGCSDDCLDAAKEIANITTGQLLPALFGTEPMFALTPPEAEPVPFSAMIEVLTANQCPIFEVEERVVAATVTVD